MSNLQFTTIDRIFAKLYRELHGTDINKADVIEYIGEALDFLKVYPILEEAVQFIEVKNFEAEIPKCLHLVLQIAKHNSWTKAERETCEISISKSLENDNIEIPTCDNSAEGVNVDCQGELEDGYTKAYYRPFYNLDLSLDIWNNTSTYFYNFTPVYLKKSNFFNSAFLKKDNSFYDKLYNMTRYEYIILNGNDISKFRFNFEEGFIALAYLKNKLDNETGYPLIPDNISFLTAITNYVKWKIKEWHSWNGRQGATRDAQEYERKWLKYAKQAKNYAKMPKSLDKYQNLMEQSLKIVPNLKKYSNFFND